MADGKYKYLKSFEAEDRLLPCTWIVVRIDGCDFSRFSEVHDFDKPNDEKALNLMNACAITVLEKFPDMIFAYGVGNEYSFVMKKMTEFCQRSASKILSLTVSLLTSVYVMKWKEFFPQKELKDLPYFDGRVICYPSAKILQDYLAWRQVDCHANNQYNTCFWMLVESGKSKTEAHELLKGTQTQEKNELLFQQFGINYNTLPAIFRKGSSVFRNKVEESRETVNMTHNGQSVKTSKVFVGHFDITRPRFWKEHPDILFE